MRVRTASVTTEKTWAGPDLARSFAARALELTREEDRKTIDRIAEEVNACFPADLAARPSRHFYVSTLPSALVAPIHRLRSLPLIEQAIRAQFPGDVTITPMHETDELYICHYNKDGGGDHGLFAKHYDGNLRFIPYGTVVRALVYVRSDGDYEVVFGDSGLSRRFATYELGLLDFHRELHWVEGRYRAGAPERIVLKCNYLVTPAAIPRATRMLLWLNRSQFYVVKAAMEYSKSPRTPAQRVVGWVCNAVRLLNNVHPLLPHIAAVTLLGLIVAALAAAL